MEVILVCMLGAKKTQSMFLVAEFLVQKVLAHFLHMLNQLGVDGILIVDYQLSVISNMAIWQHNEVSSCIALICLFVFDDDALIVAVSDGSAFVVQDSAELAHHR